LILEMHEDNLVWVYVVYSLRFYFLVHFGYWNSDTKDDRNEYDLKILKTSNSSEDESNTGNAQSPTLIQLNFESFGIQLNLCGYEFVLGFHGLLRGSER